MSSNPPTERHRQFRADLASLLRSYPDIPTDELVDQTERCIVGVVVDRVTTEIDVGKSEDVEAARALKGGFIPVVPKPNGASDGEKEAEA